MAIQFLNNLNLNDNQLLNAKVQVASTAPTAAKGQIYLDSTTNVNTFKYHDGSQWIGLKQLNLNNSTFINLSNLSATGSNVISLEASLNATGTPDNTKFLRGDNTWAAPLQYAGWTLSGNTGTSQLISSGDTASILGAGVITTAASATDTITITHSNVTRTDTTSTASPAAGGTFTAVDSVTSSAQGHITALNLKTVTLPADTNTYPTTFAWTDGTTAGPTGSLTGTSPTVAYPAIPSASVSASGVITTSTQSIAGNKTFTGNTVMSGTLTVNGTGQSSFAGQVTIPTTPVASTDAASKAYVDLSTTGALIFQGGYDASTNTPNLDSPPTGVIKKGFMWTVTVDGTFFTEQVRVGDSLIAKIDTPTTLADWTTVQSNIDLATLTTVGLGNVNAGSGIGVAYSNGTATVTNTDKGSSQNIFKNIAVSGQSTVVAETNDDTLTLVAGSAIAITTNASTDTITIASTYTPEVTSYATTISVTGTVTHNLGTKDVIVQLYDTVTFDTVYADVSRPTTNTITVSFATAPTNPIRVLVQK